MKRLFSLLLAAALVIGLLGGCTQQNTPETAQTEENTMPKNIMQKSDPAQDDELNILMIGNSGCYYYVEELYGLLTAAGYKNVNVCNVYYSGCPLKTHWEWWKSGEANYEFFTTNADGRNKLESMSLEYCMQQRNWDVISLQESSSKIRNGGGVQTHLPLTRQYLTDLWDYIKEQFPLSRYLWHQTFAYQIGYDRNGYKMETPEQQRQDAETLREYSMAVCDEYQLERVNCGDAWQLVRDGGYDNLCARLGINGNLGDGYHDGDIGGGQYLSACVWFEIITGQSCIGNTYRPDYALDENLVPTLQEAAQQAVAQRDAAQ